MEIVQPVFTELIWLLIGGFAGLLASVVGTFLASRDDRRALALLVAGPAMITLSTVVGGWAGLHNPEVSTGVAAALLLRMVAVVVLLPVVSTLGLGLSVVAWGQGTRPSRWHVLPVLLVAGAMVATVVEGSVGGNPVLGGVRAVVYATVGLSALLATGSRRLDLALGAALGWGLVVGIVEGASRALVSFMALTATVRMLGPDKRREGLDAMLSSVASEVPYGIAAVVVGGVLAVVVSISAARGERLRAMHVVCPMVWAVAWAGYSLGLPDHTALVNAALAGP